MTPPKILICNYTPAEEKAWRFLLRGFPMLEVVSVPPPAVWLYHGGIGGEEA